MFKKGLVETLEQNMGGYTARATLLFFLVGTALVLFCSLIMTELFLSKETIFLICLQSTKLISGSVFKKIIMFPALNLIYFFGLAGASILGSALLFVSYIVFKRHPFSLEWDRFLALLMLLFFAPILLHCYTTDGVTSFVLSGQLGMQGGAYLFTIFDEVMGVLFLELSCIIAFILLSRFTITSYVSMFMQRVRDYVSQGSGEKIEESLGMNQMQKGVSEFHQERSMPSEDPVSQFDTVEKEVNQSSIAQANQLDNDVRMDLSTTEDQDEEREEEDEQYINHDYMLPDGTLFKTVPVSSHKDQTPQLQEQATILEDKLSRFGIKGTVVNIKPGPVVTLFEYEPEVDSKISKIIALEDDLALALQALSIRIIAPIPGTSVVGFEVANSTRKKVLLSRAAHSSSFKSSQDKLPLILGEDTAGNEVVVDLTKMPHLLVAGSTGSGKSVALNALLVSLLCKKDPDELKLILIDPKRLEFASYEDIPHLLFPIVTEAKKVAPVLRWVVQEMERRYEMMAQQSARNIFDYQSKVQNDPEATPLPYLVVVIDELSDLMMLAGKEVEDLIARITQMARAAGIHMVVATQRPSVDVITGTIKVNFPSRISFRVTSKVDSRTILDCGGAEKLLGSGDMLFLDSSSSVLKRVHGAFVSDNEIKQLVDYIRAQRPAAYQELTVESKQGAVLDVQDDQLYRDVKQYLQTIDEISISLVQRKFRIGYNRSARIIEMLELDGLIMPSQGGKTRKVVR